MRTAAALVMLGGVSGCGLYFDDPDPLGDAGPITDGAYDKFDLDIEVMPTYVQIWFRVRGEPPCQPEQHFPRLGECAEYTDAFSCNGSTDTCLTRVAIERDGAAIVEYGPDSFYDWWYGLWLEAPMIHAPGTTLVVEGCGGQHRFDLPATPAPIPVLQDVATADGWLLAAWSSDGAPTGIQTSLGGGVGGVTCHIDAGSPGRVPVPPITSVASRGLLRLESVVDSGRDEPPWGSASIWNTTGGYATDVVIPMVAADGELQMASWDLSNTLARINAQDTSIGTIGFRLIPGGGMSLHLVGERFEYWSDATTMDTLLVDTIDGRFSGSFPHVVPRNALDLSLDGDTSFDVVVGPVVLRRETDPTDTRSFRLTLRFDHPHIARPYP